MAPSIFICFEKFLFLKVRSFFTEELVVAMNLLWGLQKKDVEH